MNDLLSIAIKSKLRTIASIFVAILSVSGYSSFAVAATPVSCGNHVSGFLNAQYGGSDWLEVTGTMVSARGRNGFSAFAMRDGFQIETNPLHTPGGAPQSNFEARRITNDVYSGNFHVVFPGRGNGDEDRWAFWVNRSGRLWLRSITYGATTWTQLSGVACFSGEQGQLVVTGHTDTPGYGSDFWTFVMQRYYLF